MAAERIDQIIENVRSLPPLPAAVEKVIRMADNPEVDPNEMAIIIHNDSSLTARILRVANSSFFGLSRTVGTVSQAIMILGFQGVKNLALGMSVLDRLQPRQRTSSLPIEDIWRHSMAVASAARMMTARTGLSEPEEAFVAGLLHDMGKLVLMNNFGEEWELLLEIDRAQEKRLYQLEKEAFGMDHAEVGFVLCEHWNIPAKMSRIIAEHHLPPKRKQTVGEEDVLCYAVQAGNSMAKIAQIGSSGDSHVEGTLLEIVDSEKLTKEGLRQILLALPEEVSKTEAFLKMGSAKETLTQEEKTKPPAIALIVEDDGEREILAMSLLSMGYSLVNFQRSHDGDTRLVAVIADKSISPSSIEELEQRGVPVLDLLEWKKESHTEGKASMHIPSLRSWLKSKLAHY